MRVLILAAHPDDELMGVAATANKLRARGHEVEFHLIGLGRGSALDNRLDSVPLLDLVVSVEITIGIFKPDRIYTHSSADLNVDHTQVYRAVVTATRPLMGSCVKEVYSFETPSATDWGFGERRFSPNVFEEISEADFKVKIDMLMQKYQEEMRPFPHPRSPEYIRAMAVKWGGFVGVPLAEAFELVRSVRNV